MFSQAYHSYTKRRVANALDRKLDLANADRVGDGACDMAPHHHDFGHQGESVLTIFRISRITRFNAGDPQRLIS
jgi:hypothetical protein